MIKLKKLLSVSLAIMIAETVSSQVLQPVIQWEVESAIGEGASDVTAFMDYTDDVCMSMWAGAGAEAGIVSVNSDGTTNFMDVWWDLALKAGGVHNLGSTSYVISLNSSTNMLIQYLISNESGSVINLYTVTIPFNYSNAKIITTRQLTIGDSEIMGILLKVLDSSDNLYKSLLVIIEKDPFGVNSAEIHPITGFVRNSTPVSMLLTNTDFFVWGYVDKNAGGTTHDNFITKVHNDGEIFSVVYQKIHFSYAGRDDVATDLVMDMEGNIFGISQSEDNISPYYDHIAVFKINPANGNRIWIRRIGEGIIYNEYGHSAAANLLGNGLAITGSVSDGAGGTNGRTWRLNSSGTTMWTKTINQTGPGTIEEGREINFCMGSGDFNVMGYRNSDNNFFIARYNTTTGIPAWPVEVYDGEFAGQVIDGSMNLGSSPTSDIYCNYLIQNGLVVSMVTTKFSQVVLREGDEQISEAGINIFPNPAADYIQISGIEVNSLFQIININGQVVFEKQIDLANPVLNIQCLPQGCYTCRIYTGNETKTLQFIKSK